MEPVSPDRSEGVGKKGGKGRKKERKGKKGGGKEREKGMHEEGGREGRVTGGTRPRKRRFCC